MKTKKTIYDVLFILISGIILIVLDEYGLLEKHAGFALIPILIAYFAGQFVERKFKYKSK